MHCENSDLKRDGTNVTWIITCKSNDATQSGKGRMSVFGDSYLGTAEVELRNRRSGDIDEDDLAGGDKAGNRGFIEAFAQIANLR